MAFLYISEYADLGNTRNAQTIQMAAAPPVAEQTVANAGATTQSAAFNNQTRFVRLHTDTVCSVAFGANPTATTASARLAAGSTEYFGVPQGQAFKVAAILNT